MKREEYAVYSAMIEEIYLKDQVKLLVIVNPTCCADLDKSKDNIYFGPEQPSPLLQETFENYLERNKSAKTLKRSFNLKIDYVLVGYDEIRKLIQTDPTKSAFKDFYLRYPGSQGYITLSRIGFNRKRDQALVFTGLVCDVLCGEGKYILLEKKDGGLESGEGSVSLGLIEMPNRKIIVYIATSADGYIARKDGAVDWLDRPRTAGDYGMGKFYHSIDTIIWGRKTYDMVFRFAEEGKDNPESYRSLKNYAFSRRPPRKVASGFEFVKEPIKDFARRLRATKGKDVWIMGGAGIIASFLDESEIDQFIIHVVPTFIGEGIPLIAPRHRTVPLKLVSCKKFSDGVVRLHYEVKKAKPKSSHRNSARNRSVS